MNQRFFFLLIGIVVVSFGITQNAYAVTVYPGTVIGNSHQNLTANVSPYFNVTSITANSTHIFFNDRYFDFSSIHGLVPANITAFSENNNIRLHITSLGFADITLKVKGKVSSVQLNFLTFVYGDHWLYDGGTNETTINVNSRQDVYLSFTSTPTSATVTTVGSIASQTVHIQSIATLSSPAWATIWNQQLYVNGSLYSTINYPPSVIVLGSNTLGLQSVPGVLYTTSFQTRILVGSNTGNITITGNIINFGSGPRVPDPPTLNAITEGPTTIRFITIPGTSPGTSPVKDYSLQCKLNNGLPIFIVTNSTLPPGRLFSYTGLSPGDSVACKWRDGSSVGWSGFSNEANAKAGTLSIVQVLRIPDSNPLSKVIKWIDSMGGVYFGFSVIPLAVMLIGMLATPKTTGIFALGTLFIMGMIQGAGFYVYPNWFWGIMLLLGIIIVLGRANEKER